jgi:hypothetical protein
MLYDHYNMSCDVDALESHDHLEVDTVHLQCPLLCRLDDVLYIADFVRLLCEGAANYLGASGMCISA